jgi:hypothetical protein
MTETPFPVELVERLWHTTSPSRYEAIVASGSILPNPTLPDSERWKTSRGPEFHPYVRVLGGVSLFDFRGFEPDVYSAKYPMSSWRTFVPYRREWKAAIWIEIDRILITDNYLDPPQLLTRWKGESAERHTIMPMIEGVHVGPIPAQAMLRVLEISEALPSFKEVRGR